MPVPPLLKLPKDLPYSVYNNAIDYQIGAAFFQTYPEKTRKPMRFVPRTLAVAERNQSILEKKCSCLGFLNRTIYCAYETCIVAFDFECDRPK